MSVYEALKTDKTRKRYDQVLIEGLPDWRHGARYYFRRARKLSTMELSVFISIIISVGHYFVLWASHFEKRLTLEDRMSEVKKKLDKKRAKRAYKGSELDDIDAQLQECYDTLPSPVLKDTLPYRFVILLVNTVIGLPAFVSEKLKKKEPVVESSESEEEEVLAPRRSNKEHLGLNPTKIEKSSIKLETTTSQEQKQSSEDESARKNSREWTDKDKSELIKAVNKFPAGTPNRWNKIADMMNRQPQDCISMDKHIRANFTSNNYLNNSTWSEKKTTVLNHKEAPEPTVKLDENFNETSDKWTQDQQAKFEKALKDFNKDTPNRWDRIAEQVDHKNKVNQLNLSVQFLKDFWLIFLYFKRMIVLIDTSICVVN